MDRVGKGIIQICCILRKYSGDEADWKRQDHHTSDVRLWQYSGFNLVVTSWKSILFYLLIDVKGIKYLFLHNKLF